MKSSARKSAEKRLGIREIKAGMKVQWRKNGVTSSEVLEILRLEKSRSGKTTVHFKHPDGKVSANHNAGNRYVLVG